MRLLIPFLFILLLPIVPVQQSNSEPIGILAQQIWATHATTKIFQDQSGILSTLPQGNQTVSLSLAKGGFGAFQVVLSPSQALSGITANVGTFSSGNNNLPDKAINLYLEYYVNVREETLFESVNDYQLGLYPDALLPLTEPFDVEGSKNQPIWVEVIIPSDTPAGTYSGSIDFSGGITGSIQVSIQVLDFTIPLKNPLYNPAYLDLWELEQFTSTSKELDQISMDYVEFFAKRGILASDTIDAMGVLPSYDNGQWNFDDWKNSIDPLLSIYSEYFSTPVVRVPVNFGEVLGFEVEEAATDDSFQSYTYFLQQFRDFVVSNGMTDIQWLVWIDDLDEPDTAEKAWLIAKYALLTHEAGNDQVQFHYRVDGTIDWDSPIVQFDLETDTSGWEPLNDKFTAWSAPQEDIEWDTQFINDAIKRNAKVTAYEQAWTALKLPEDEEEYPPGIQKKDYEFPSVAGIVNPALFSRILPWIVYKYNLAGVNFWAAMAWYNSQTDQIIDPYVDSPALRIRGSTVAQNGDGFLVYPGTLVDEHSTQKDTIQPVSSLRLELFRLGIEDYKYIKTLEEANLGNQQETQNLIDAAMKLVSSVTQFEREPNEYDRAIGSIKEFLNQNKDSVPSSLQAQNWDFNWQPSPLENEEVPDEGIPIQVWPFLVSFATIVIIRKYRKIRI
ncbi:MAG: DUF4091 domain-containing protein [Methanobacteriota archaeon]|nr:MAG: DUF4091 domain-containing protein [Euryarchaeota archaeon]